MKKNCMLGIFLFTLLSCSESGSIYSPGWDNPVIQSLGVVFIILVIISLYFISEYKTCQVGCFIVVIILIIGGIKNCFYTKNNNETFNPNVTNNTQNNHNNSLDLEDLHKLINEVNSGDDSSLSNYTKADLRILRNMVFAEKGFRIQKAGLKEYFEQKSWYNPYIDNQNDISLNIKEKRFLKAVQKYEEN